MSCTGECEAKVRNDEGVLVRLRSQRAGDKIYYGFWATQGDNKQWWFCGLREMEGSRRRLREYQTAKTSRRETFSVFAM